MRQMSTICCKLVRAVASESACLNAAAIEGRVWPRVWGLNEWERKWTGFDVCYICEGDANKNEWLSRAQLKIDCKLLLVAFG